MRRDGHELSAYVALPPEEPLAALVVIQEIFGVNTHIRSVADGYAKDGFLVTAPALFDRVQHGIELGYEGADLERAMTLARSLTLDKAVADIQPALDYAATTTGKSVGVIGYCFGGILAWLTGMARRSSPSAYGGCGLLRRAYRQLRWRKPTCPVMLHFGRKDAHIPAEEVEKIHAAHPEVEIFWYDAGHAFNCNPRANYNATAAREARGRSLDFLKKHLA